MKRSDAETEREYRQRLAQETLRVMALEPDLTSPVVMAWWAREDARTKNEGPQPLLAKR